MGPASSSLFRSARLSFLLAITAPAALAADWYVDKQTGNDANNGSSPSTAWRTLSFAVQQLQPIGVGPPQTIHVSAGVYDAAHGEQFPLSMRPWIQILGTPGGTVLDGGGTDLLRFDGIVGNQPFTFDSNCRVDSVTLRNGHTAITASTNWNPSSPSFHEVHITGMGGPGVLVSTTGFGPHTGAPTFFGSSIDHCREGIRLHAQSTAAPPGSDSRVILTDSTISDCTSSAIAMTAPLGMNTGVDLTRCRIVRNGGVAIQAGTNGYVNVSLRTCLVANNLLGGLHYQSATIPVPGLQCVILESTFAQNGGTGFRSVGTSPPITLRDSIFFGNGDDVDLVAGGYTASFCVSGDGDLNAQPSCSSVDPNFVDPNAQDFRLRFGSPCIDSADPTIATGGLDLAGNLRNVDGNLDTDRRRDRGCFEFRPLGFVSTGQLGTPVRFELFGSAGGTTTVLFTRSGLGSPQNTPFGVFDLGPSSGTLLTSPVAPGPPVVFQRPIPNLPGMIGQTFSFQARTTSSLAPMGLAYTNAVSMTIVP